MRDLEIRGAGNLFGFEQSGHIGRVGLSLYNKILSETINEKRGLVERPVRQPVSVSFDGAALFGVDLFVLLRWLLGEQLNVEGRCRLDLPSLIP